MKLKKSINQKIFKLKTDNYKKLFVLSTLKNNQDIFLNKVLLSTSLNVFDKSFMKNNLQYIKGDFNLNNSKGLVYAKYGHLHFKKKQILSKFFFKKKEVLLNFFFFSKFFFFLSFFKVQSSWRKDSVNR